MPVDLFQDRNWGGLVGVLSDHHAEHQHRENLHGRTPGRHEIHFKVQNSLTNTFGYIQKEEMLNTKQSEKFILDSHSGVQEDDGVTTCVPINSYRCFGSMKRLPLQGQAVKV